MYQSQFYSANPTYSLPFTTLFHDVGFYNIIVPHPGLTGTVLSITQLILSDMEQRF